MNCMWQKLIPFTNMKTVLLKSNCHHRALCSCCGLTYSREAVHAFYPPQQEAPCALGFMETSLIRNRALSGVLCLIWVKCKPCRSRSIYRTKSLCRLSGGLIFILCIFPIIWLSSLSFFLAFFFNLTACCIHMDILSMSLYWKSEFFLAVPLILPGTCHTNTQVSPSDFNKRLHSSAGTSPQDVTD